MQTFRATFLFTYLFFRQWYSFFFILNTYLFFFFFFQNISSGRYPVVLSIENHCSIQQQKKIAQYLRDIFGDKLDVGDILNRDSATLPSPHSLRGKILIKVSVAQGCWQRINKIKPSMSNAHLHLFYALFLAGVGGRGAGGWWTESSLLLNITRGCCYSEDWEKEQGCQEAN